MKLEAKKIAESFLYSTETRSEAAIVTHYLHNYGTKIASWYEKEAKAILEKTFAESGYCLTTLINIMLAKVRDVPFPTPESEKFTFIDLFSGIGGFRIALQNLGGRCIFSSEWDSQAQKTYQTNFGEVPFGDITKSETKKFIPDKFDILCAGFPCQAFSIAGRRGGFSDTRGTLFFDVATIIQEKQPRAILLENVKGLISHDRGRTLDTIIRTLRNDLNYYVPDPEIINAKDFGVPQNRERVFIVGFRNDLNINEFEYPNPMDTGKTFADVKEENVVSAKYYLSTQYLDTLRKHKERHKEKGNGFGYEIIQDDDVANAIVVGGMGRERNLVFDHRITDFTPVTRIKGEVNREGIRKMTPREWARLQGFPDRFIIPVADSSAYKQFGNSVTTFAVQETARNIINILDKSMLTGNKGEWSEIYALFKLLGDKKMYAGNADLNKIESLVYPIIKILRTERSGNYEYVINDNLIIVNSNNEKIIELTAEDFLVQAYNLFDTIKNASGTFSIRETEAFMRKIKCDSIKATSESKTDIKIVIHDQTTGAQPLLGFSIKSQLGSASTLLNASGATNIVYSLSNQPASTRDCAIINGISSTGKIRERVSKLSELGHELEYSHFKNHMFQSNLCLIDSRLPEIVAEMVRLYYSQNLTIVKDIVEQLEKSNPLEFDLSSGHKFYEYKIKHMLVDIALGMKPNTVWTGKYDATGGYLVVKKDGEVLCYHFYKKNEFENYLYTNTKFDTPSSSRLGFGKIESLGGSQVFKLNFQIRFIS